MSKHLHKIKVADIRRETQDCVSVALDIPEHLRETFDYQAGQYISLKADIDGEEVRRSYSLCSSPLDNEWRVAIKKVYKGKFSTYANEDLKVGENLEAFPPDGNFTIEIDPTHKKHYVAFAAGSGITPVISLVKTVLYSEPLSSFTLFYGNRNARSIIFKEQLEGLKNQFMTRFKLFHVLSRQPSDSPLFDGRIDAEKCQQLYDLILSREDPDEFFICGPSAMIFDLKEKLENMGFDKKNIHFELFSSPEDHKKELLRSKKELHKEATSDSSHVSIKLDGKVIEFELEQEGQNVLDAGIENGADLPFSCKSGVCSTCKARLVKGEVDMDVNYALEDDEVEEGYILTCQSHPRSEEVFVDYDH